MTADHIDPAPVLAAYGLDGARYSPLGSGLINRTLLIESGRDRFVLQALHPVFPAAINRDIDALTRHLRARGLPTPTLVPANDGALWVEHGGVVWRLMTWIDGTVRDALENPRQARAAGKLLARFHRAVDDLGIDFANPRLGVHDTPRHLANLETALAAHRDHPRFALIEPLARRILDAARSLPALAPTPDRIVHGDPKINNMLFAPDDSVICMIDLDTIGRMPLPLELGDAFRSWCNPASEDGRRGKFDSELFRAAAEGYAGVAAGWIHDDEWASILPATQTILVELAARFCADALNESYFGWDPQRFPSRSEHNQVRAEGQLSVAESLSAQRDALERVVRQAAPGRS